MAHSRTLFAKNCFDESYKIAGDREFLVRLWPLRLASVRDVVQGEMVLGGLSNSPEAFAQAKHEDAILVQRYGLRPSPVKKVKNWVKGLLYKYPKLWSILQRNYLRVRSE
jgi:hypothetical protein